MSKFVVNLNEISAKPTNGAGTGIRAEIINSGDSPAAINAVLATDPSLVLELQDIEGKPLGLPPPSPPGEKELKTMREIPPGGSITIDYYGALDLYHPSGRYRVRYFSECHLFGGKPGDPVVSDWLEFEVVCPPQTFLEPGKNPVVMKRQRLFGLRWKLCRCLRCWILKVLGFERCNRQIAQEVDLAHTEVISDAPPGFEAWNGTYSWHARFRTELARVSGLSNFEGIIYS